MKIKKETKHLNFYHSMMQPEAQRPCFLGLCNAACDKDIDPNILAEISPTDSDRDELVNCKLSCVWWGSGLPANATAYELQYVFTPLRQTLVLLMAAINNEL